MLLPNFLIQVLSEGRFPSFCPLWTQLSPDHVQVAQGEQHIQLSIVFMESLVTSLFVLEDVLHDMERVLDSGSNACLELFKGQRQIFLPAFFHLTDRLSAFGYVPANFIGHALQFLLHLFPFDCSNISRISVASGI